MSKAEELVAEKALLKTAREQRLIAIRMIIESEGYRKLKKKWG